MYRYLLLFFCNFFLLHGSLQFKVTDINTHQKKVQLTFNGSPQDWIYKESFNVSIDDPTITISTIHIPDSTIMYDHTYKEKKSIYPHQTSFEFLVTKPDNYSGTDASLHVLYATNQTPQQFHEVFPLNFSLFQPSQTIEPLEIIDDEQTVNDETHQENINNLNDSDALSLQPNPEKPAKKLSSWISKLVKTTESIPLRLLLVFFLGILLSLTPCIYPMIPITVGVLQTQGSTSFLVNFLRSTMYTCGMATTFALFGLFAGFLGPISGRLLTHPLFVIILVIFLSYLALSMIGFYELTIPKLLQIQQNKKVKQGSYLSSFILGAASGTIASPCVSPGLALLLSVVATLGNPILGFLLLFSFGIGLSAPLFIVGTFSSSINMLPKAGIWMVEVKRFFGFMMLAMCLYYLSSIIAPLPMLFTKALFAFIVGGYYLYISIYNVRTTFGRLLTTLLGIVISAFGLFISINIYQKIFYPEFFTSNEKEYWHYNYQQALTQAQQQNKLLFIDFWATFCSICISINKNLLTDQRVINALQKNFIPLKVDGTNITEEPYALLKDRYHITGFPTFLIVDPTTETILNQWGSEIYSLTPEEFVNQLEKARGK